MEADLTGFFEGREDFQFVWSRVGKPKKAGAFTLPPNHTDLSLLHPEDRLNREQLGELLTGIRKLWLRSLTPSTRAQFRSWGKVEQSERGEEYILRVTIRSLFYS